MTSQLKHPYLGKCLSIITGASRGFGNAIAKTIGDKENGLLGHADAGSKIILMSRDGKELEKTKKLIDPSFDVMIVPVDLSDLLHCQEIINKTLETCGTDYNHTFLFNNAGALGDPSKRFSDYDNIEEIQHLFNLNTISASFLISRFCKHFKGTNRFVVQISSLAALQPFPCISLYSSTKACMDMFIRTVAADCPDVRAINYAPGPMDTDMGRDVMKRNGDPDTKKYHEGLFNEGKIIQPVDSVKKLMLLLRNNEFVNASHVDFYDI